MKRMDLLTHPKWQQFLIRRSQVITWILNHHPDLFQSPAKAGGFCKAVLHTDNTHTRRHRVISGGSRSAWGPSLVFGNNRIFPWFWATVCCLSHPLNPGLQSREKQKKEVGNAEMSSLSARHLLSVPKEAPGAQQHPGHKEGPQSVESSAGHSPQTCYAPGPEHHLQQGFKVSKLSPLACTCEKSPLVLTPQ